MSEETKITAGDMPKSDVLFIELPAGGFKPEQIQKYIRSGYSLWGIVPIANPNAASGLILPEATQAATTDYMVLTLDVNAIPVNLLAHHLVKARNDKGGLNQVAEQFFGMSIGGLEAGLKLAQEKANGR
jgi:hypothetical protein